MEALLQTLRITALIWLAIENLRVAFFFMAISNRSDMQIFKTKYWLFLLNGFQYLIGFFIAYVRLTTENDFIIFTVQNLSLLFVIPLIIAVRKYRKAFTEGEVIVKNTPYGNRKEAG